MICTSKLVIKLAALGLLSMACSSDDKPAAVRLSDRGQTCQSTADCAGSLICAGGQCTDSTVGISPTSKQCFLNQCEKPEDCCPASTATCVPENYTCDSNLCHRSATSCTASTDCQTAFATDPVTGRTAYFCFTDESKCVECLQPADCAATTQTCADHHCVTACTVDSDCQALYSCQDSQCKYKGCSEDRECKVLKNNALAYCDSNKQCQTSQCTSDTQCFHPTTPTPVTGSGNAYAYQVCISGTCQNAGCDTDDECKALLQTYLTATYKQQYPKITAQCK
jgi:hypothetical protein